MTCPCVPILADRVCSGSFSPSLLPSLLAAPLEKLTVERINSEPSLSGTLPSRFQWHPDGKRLTFLRRGAGDSTSLFALDADERERVAPAGRVRAEDTRRDASPAPARDGQLAARRPDAARPGAGRRLHGRRAQGVRARAGADEGEGGVRRGLPRRPRGRLRPRQRPLRGGRGDRPGNAPDPERLRHAAERQARLGLRGGARLAHRPVVRLVAGLAGRSPTSSWTRRACPPSRSSTSCRSATRSSGSTTRRRARRTRSSASASWASTRTAARDRSASSPSRPTTSTCCPSSAGRPTPAAWRSST